MILEEIKARASAIAAIAAAAVIVAAAGWALLERAGRLQCEAHLVEARDQVKVLADKLERQGKAIEALSSATLGVQADTGRLLDELERQGEASRAALGGLKRQLAAPTPRKDDGSTKGCADYLKEWRAVP